MSSVFPYVQSSMKEKGLSQKKLREEMIKRGYVISKSALSLKLNDKRRIFTDEMELIANILNKDPVYLFFGHEFTKGIHK